MYSTIEGAIDETRGFEASLSINIEPRKFTSKWILPYFTSIFLLFLSSILQKSCFETTKSCNYPL